MEPETKKKVLIGLSIAAACVLAGVLIKDWLGNKQKQSQPEQQSKPEQSKSKKQAEEKKVVEQIKKPKLDRDLMLNILKKAKVNNFALLKRISTLAVKMCQQMGMSRVEPQIVKNILESPESPVKMQQEFIKNYTEACKSFNTTYEDFKESLDLYIAGKDHDIQRVVDEIQKDYQNSLAGKVPHVKVSIPVDLTKQRILEIYKKLALKRYLLQIDIFKKVRGKTQEEIRANKQLLDNIPNPDEEENKILQDEGLGANDQPAGAVYAAALTQYKPAVGAEFQKIDSHYAHIFNRYKGKIQNNKITETELNELEDELIYSDSTY